MAQRQGTQRQASRRRAGSAAERRPSSSRTRGRQDGKAARPAEEARQSIDEVDRQYRAAQRREQADPGGPPDVLVNVPELRVDSIHLELDDLEAHVALKARVLNLVKLDVGVDVQLSRVKLDINGVEAEVVLKARLDHVAGIVDRLMTSLDRNPELVKGLSRAVGEIGEGAGQAVDETGDATKEIGQGAQSALKDVGKGAGEATGDIGQGAGQAVGRSRSGCGQAAGDLGQGGGQALGAVVGGAGQAGQAAGQSLAGLAGGGQSAGQSDGTTAKPSALAKEVAKLLAREIGQAAQDEARDLGLAATRKMRDLGERREQRRAERYEATPAARRVADELGIDLTGVEGTGNRGRITANDVRNAQEP